MGLSVGGDGNVVSLPTIQDALGSSKKLPTIQHVQNISLDSLTETKRFQHQSPWVVISLLNEDVCCVTRVVAQAILQRGWIGVCGRFARQPALQLRSP